MLIAIAPDSTIRFLYDDQLASLVSENNGEIARASHVEPYPGGGWTADMSPVGGPVLGPYPLRQIALEEEVKWLEEKLF